MMYLEHFDAKYYSITAYNKNDKKTSLTRCHPESRVKTSIGKATDDNNDHRHHQKMNPNEYPVPQIFKLQSLFSLSSPFEN